jgi:transcriptional regulator
MRTELGQSLPTITKLQYLSKRLEVPIDTFLENKELALPEEELLSLELLSLDLIERILDLIRTGTGSFAEDIFDDYFKQVTLKQVYTFNDLLLIDYFAMQCQDLIYRREH